MSEFANLEQRMVHAYLDMLPTCRPLANAEVPAVSQQRFYRFIEGVYQALYAAPEVLFASLNADDAFPNRFNRSSYGKLKLYALMQKQAKAIDGLLAWLFALGQDGVVADGRMLVPPPALNKRLYRELLPHLGLELQGHALQCEGGEGLFPAWKWMATREGATQASFGRCYFDLARPYLQEVYGGLFGDRAAYDELVRYLEAVGYARLTMQRGPYTLDYVKRLAGKEAPLGTPMHGDQRHYGVSADYRYDVAVPQYMVLRILDYRNILGEFDDLPPALQAFLVQHTKACDSCGYCTQTDKTGKRRPLAILVYYEGERVLCPLYPGFSFCFTALDEPLVANIMAFLRFMDQRFSGQAPVAPIP